MVDRSKQLQEIIEGFHKMKRFTDIKGCGTLGGRTITNSQWMTLRLISRAEAVSIKDIRLAFAISSSAATQLVGELIKKQYAVKEVAEKDKRTAVIRLTPKTKQAMLRMQETIQEHIIRLFSVLTDKEFSEYVRLNQKIITHFQ
ncbi:MAG TPA: MarR family transcriptional regulator [Candidatus Paceibacterota bacterium]|nr:MarR family transcriptional regulator [Candidatus Paceibacterota bacterium]